ncbi:Protein of unknown function [Selenomonas ruminantium]|uniref:DUF4127 family protein n=1 Tax=Selenomonas ruminantium TaxID=971 RepID=A0A1M6TVB9_SELRU|nr:DUF4127 family protein [Selenomonas ruminantium]SHK60844.1 Protein of unknown function [Selenomonas ruminantium]
MKKFFMLIALTITLAFIPQLSPLKAAPPAQEKKILFVPLDNRPITDKETRQVAEKLGYKVVVPPEELLGTREQPGNPDGLWQWLDENARGAKAAVVSTDAMLYGSLVASRNHELTQETISERVNRFRTFHADHPRLPVYGFGTILRTLLTATHSGNGMEPALYQQNAVKLRDYSMLRDKAEMGKASKKEKRELIRLEQEIVPAAMEDWTHRHELNYQANQALIDLTGQGIFSFLFLGGDDSALYSQTHYETRHLREYGQKLDKTRFQITSGADELGMVMMCRAICDDRWDIPFIYTAYNTGKGPKTIPSYCNEEIGTDVDNTIIAAGGMRVPDPQRAELVLTINTNPDGRTYEANSPANTTKPRKGTKPFVNLVQGFVDKGYPVAVADIAYGNGADNALMNELHKKGLQFKLQAYGGWNTATNTTGFLIGTGLLTKWMDKQARDELMLTRYLEEWGYQANVRQKLGGAVWSHPGYNQQTGNLDGARDFAAQQGTEWMQEFARQNITLPAGLSLDKLHISHPWNRLFECEINF